MRTAVERRTTGQESFGVGVLGIVKHLPGRALLHYRAFVHHCHIVGNLCDDPEVVSDEYNADAIFGLQGAEQLKDCFLHCHIQRCSGFVGNEKVGMAHQGHGYHDALLLSAANFVRVAVKYLFRTRQHHLFEEFNHSAPRLGTVDFFVRQEHFHYLVAAFLHRIEAGHGFLEYHADAAAPDGAERLLVKGEKVCRVRLVRPT